MIERGVDSDDLMLCYFFFSSRRRHTRYWRDWSSDVCSSDLGARRPPVTCPTGPSCCCGRCGGTFPASPTRSSPTRSSPPTARDRKSVVEGKRGDLGGRRFIKKKKQPERSHAKRTKSLQTVHV